VSPRISAYPWSAGFGTKYADPATQPGTTGRTVDFDDAGIYIGVGALSTNVYVYPWAAGFGTVYANPASLPGGNAFGIAFN
jgi:hypothetical protein